MLHALWIPAAIFDEISSAPPGRDARHAQRWRRGRAVGRGERGARAAARRNLPRCGDGPNAGGKGDGKFQEGLLAAHPEQGELFIYVHINGYNWLHLVNGYIIWHFCWLMVNEPVNN